MKKSLTEQVLNNSIWFFLNSLMKRVIALAFTIVLVRLLLPEKFGIYSLALSIAMIFLGLGDLGIDQAFTIFFSKYINKEPEKANSYFNYLFKIKISLIFILSLILGLSAYIFAKYIFKQPELLKILPISAVYIFFFSLSGFFSCFFYIYKKVKLDFIKETLFQVIRLVLVLLIIKILPQEYSIVGIFFSLLLTSVIVLLFSVYYSKKLYPILFSKSETRIDKKRIFKFLFYLLIGSISFIIFSEIDIFMLGLFLKDLKFIGYYRAVFTLIIGVWGVISVTPVLLPIFSAIGKIRLKKAVDKVLKITFMFSIPAIFGVLILGRYIIRLIYGIEYLEGAFLLNFLAFLIFSEVTINLLIGVLSSREKPRFVAKSLLIAIILNIVLDYFLIKSLLNISSLWATAGAAIATLVTRYIFMFSIMFYANKECGIKIKANYIIKPLIASLAMAAALYLIAHKIDVGIISGLLIITLGIFVYFLVLYLIRGIKKQDLKILKSNAKA